LKYTDDESDAVAVTSTVELSEALRGAQLRLQPLKLKVFELSTPLKENPHQHEQIHPCTTTSNASPVDTFVASSSYPFDLDQGLQQASEKIHGLTKSAESLLPLLQQTVEPALLQAKTYSKEQLQVLAASLKEFKDPAIQQVSSLLRSLSTKIESISNETVHSAWCDGCKKQITGVRYKCGNCADFDLCEACEAMRTHNADHIFLKLYSPLLYKEMKPLLPSLYAAAPPSAKVDAPVNNKAEQEPTVPLDAEFLRDETVQEGTTFAPDTGFVKIWSMKNTGSQAWPEGSRLLLVSGPAMGTKGDVPLKTTAKVGETIDIVVDMIAPTNVGHYTSHWRLASPDGKKFGHRIWVDIKVDNVKQPEQVKVVNNNSVAIAPKEVSPEEKALASLAELGFTNKQLNLELIKKHNGDLVAIVTALLDQQ